MKTPMVVDSDSELVNTVNSTAAKVTGVTQESELLHGLEKVAFADAGNQGADNRKEATGVKWQVSMNREAPSTGQGRAIQGQHSR